jgi:hypothetical protein
LRIVEADLWERGYLDLVEPANMSLGKNAEASSPYAPSATMELGYGQRIVF